MNKELQVTKKKSKWYVIDASDKILGRLASELACLLRGKHKVEYVPYLSYGDYCIVLNAGRIVVTGRKKINKRYFHHTGYPGGIKECTFSEMLARAPERVIEIAVKGMLPKGPLGRIMYRKLRVYSGSKHPHVAQKPSVLELSNSKKRY
ncbi:50S ribosomal protein L13 [Blochmannia endosymbiont of Polyrhachis (Hedomyrma) turneri]|uniref:50S ribosomal protein L13 n=1 Tax=Blochmannia endosymbiont of Polyrhachis (Hedomyrma) turneri TaxID=1505596 RepID=UPI00061A68A3|nr:50S ribosomal protein L13 [Blochmannia endosymbiont of Polyrhachis (Hedomyrma) turneri]AKC59641.1 50S ribosomal protein L13 [Blochmannia endosymbiont of Polyrhachis (Hedomyrma) turneri]